MDMGFDVQGSSRTLVKVMAVVIPESAVLTGFVH